jgi:hypothetical protein
LCDDTLISKYSKLSKIKCGKDSEEDHLKKLRNNQSQDSLAKYSPLSAPV